MKLLILLPLVLLSACTCINVATPEITASYCSSKDISDLEFEYKDISVTVGKSDNQAADLVKGAVDAFMLKEKKAKDVLEALTNE